MVAYFFLEQPYEFKVGSTPGKERKREFVDNPNGLFSAQAAPKPPPAMYFITEGMKVGGKVRKHYCIFAFYFLQHVVSLDLFCSCRER